MDKETTQPNAQQIGYVRSEEFYEDYANNVFLEASFWDLRLIFGQLDQSAKPPVTEQRSAVTIPWTQVKILAFLLRIHIFAYEAKNGKIVVPPDVVPPGLPAPTDEMIAQDPNIVQVAEYLNRLRRESFDL
jgi:hypothetical protein